MDFDNFKKYMGRMRTVKKAEIKDGKIEYGQKWSIGGGEREAIYALLSDFLDKGAEWADVDNLDEFLYFQQSILNALGTTDGPWHDEEVNRDKRDAAASLQEYLNKTVSHIRRMKEIVVKVEKGEMKLCVTKPVVC
jgi:hypothetical protein